jgi:dihydroneopterin aldolase
MSDLISILGVSAIGYHGVFPEERRDGQEFIVDADLQLDLSAAGESDDLTKTIDYSKVADLIVFEITRTPVNLIEALATRICAKILGEFSQVDKLKITVHKPSAPVVAKFSDISVTIERSR